ncbi:MAG: hypothetical protein ABSB71_10355 [Candidatus Bathyarchaeia archaeon]|jgi:hypothetical protein
MNRESYKSKRKGQPKRISKITGSESRMAAAAKERIYYTQPQMHEAYNTKIEWVRNVIPKLKNEVEA